MLAEIGQLLRYRLWGMSRNEFIYAYPILYISKEHMYDEYTVRYVHPDVIIQLRHKFEILHHPEHDIYLFHPKRNIWTVNWIGK